MVGSLSKTASSAMVAAAVMAVSGGVSGVCIRKMCGRDKEGKEGSDLETGLGRPGLKFRELTTTTDYGYDLAMRHAHVHAQRFSFRARCNAGRRGQCGGVSKL